MQWFNKSRPRAGMALLIVLICLIVVTALVAAMLRNMVLVSRQSKQQWNALQAAWLAESGVERAMFLLRRNADYPGETWLVQDTSLGNDSGYVEIQVDQDASQDRVQVRVRATFPEGRVFAATARREIQMTRRRSAAGANTEIGETHHAVD